MTVVDKIIEQIPYGDGAIRRSFITGLIFITVFISSCAWNFPNGAQKIVDFGKIIGFEPKDLLTSPQALFVAAIVLFAFGAIADAMIDGYIVRGVSMSLFVFNYIISPSKDWSTLERVCYWIVILLLAFLFFPLTILICTLLNSLGVEKLYMIGLTQNKESGLANSKKTLLSEQAFSFYRNRLSITTQKGLDQLYGDQSASAWQRLMDYIPKHHRPWFVRLNARNRDLASFIAAAMFSLILSYPVIPWNLSKWLVIYVIIFFLSYLFAGCAKIVQRSTVSILEFAADTHGT